MTNPKPDTAQRIRAGALFGPLKSLAREKNVRFRPNTTFLHDVKSAEQFIDAGLYLDAMEQMEQASYDDDFALRAGFGQDFRETGIVGKAIVHAETLWESLQTFRVGMGWYQSDSELSISLRYGRCRLHYTHAFPHSLAGELDTQYTIALLANVINQASWATPANMTIGFPRAKESHKAIFPTANSLIHTRTGVIEINDSLLRSPMKKADVSIALSVAAALLKSDWAVGEEPDLSAQVKSLQMASLEETQAPLHLEKVSYILGMPSRTLQHNLSQDGSSFADLRAQARHLIARKALIAGHSIQKTSELVGYAQSRTFSAAFSEWEGTTPSVFSSRGKADRLNTTDNSTT